MRQKQLQHYRGICASCNGNPVIIKQELGLAKTKPNSGSFIIEELTDLVEALFIRIRQNYGTWWSAGAMETMYQRSKIQESLDYETLKHTGEFQSLG
jgi:methylmalonyl-CoA mutase N-terminal domain/subunit